MGEIDIAIVLASIRPGAEWSLNGNNYDQLTWHDSTSKPSLQEIESAWPEVWANGQNEQMRHLRMSAFRDEADPLFFGWQRGENTEQEWLNKCEEIRQRFPYVPVPPLS